MQKKLSLGTVIVVILVVVIVVAVVGYFVFMKGGKQAEPPSVDTVTGASQDDALNVPDTQEAQASDAGAALPPGL